MRTARMKHGSSVALVLSIGLCLSVGLSACASSSTPSPSSTPTSSALVINANPAPTPTPLPKITAVSSPTATATVIFATEAATPSPTGAPAKDGVIWGGTIISETSRQYIINGDTVDLCKTSWEVDVLFVVSPQGDVRGDGKATLAGGPDCSPHPLSDNSTNADVSVEGLKDNSQFRLRLTSSNWVPDKSGDLAAFYLLFDTGQCDPIPHQRTLEIPLASDDSVNTTLNFNETMTGCAGATDDVVINAAKVDLLAKFSCSDIPAGTNDPEVEKLCQ